MPDNYEFKITEDHRSEDDKTTKMRLENPYYQVKIYYMGSFNADREAGGLDAQVLSIGVHPKKGTVVRFTYNVSGSYLDAIGLEFLPMDKVLDMFEPIKNAVESEKALRTLLEEILGPMRPRETTEKEDES